MAPTIMDCSSAREMAAARATFSAAVTSVHAASAARHAASAAERFSSETASSADTEPARVSCAADQGLTLVHIRAQLEQLQDTFVS